MEIIERYGKYIEKKIGQDPGFAGKLIRFGLFYESLRLGAASLRTRADKADTIPAALNFLNRKAIKSVAKAISSPEKTVWVNLFAPNELLSVFGLRPLSIECFSAFMGGFRIEDYLLRHAEDLGMSDTLCSYHKCFIGAADTEIIKPPLLSLTTTLACDGNVNTFRFIENRLGIKSFVVDIPYEYSDEALSYVAKQLRRLISLLEQLTGKSFNEDSLRKSLSMENETRKLREEILVIQGAKKYPSTLSLQMFRLFATHILPGTKDSLDFYRLLESDIKKYPEQPGPRIMWVHLMPYYQETLKEYLGPRGKYQIITSDFDFDYGFGRRLDPENPVESLAEKLIMNIFNGPYPRKTVAALEMAKTLNADGVIHFCHWGCKQSAGGAFEMKRAFDEAGIPFLILDGDGIDRRNDAPEQIRTRTEAFFEMINERRGI